MRTRVVTNGVVRWVGDVDPRPRPEEARTTGALKTRKQRRIMVCRLPDRICLQGGCSYCSGGPSKEHWWRTSKQLARYAEQRGWFEDYLIGRKTFWPNYPKKVS